MNSMKKIALLGFLLAGTAGYAAAQTAETAPVAGQDDVQMADRGDGQGWGHGHGKGHGGRGDHNGRGGRRMQIIDANGDGVIGEDEAATLADHLYQRLDQNGDGTVDKAEFSTPPNRGHGGGMRGWFGTATAEATAIQKLREEAFAQLDADKDGKLTKVEFFADAKAKLAAADTDKDGKVSPWEFRAAN